MDFNKTKSVFFDLLEIPSEEHEGYIERVCGDDQLLKARVRGLISAHASAGEFLGQTSISHEQAALPTVAPTKIGPYEVIKTLGQGGFGTVYLCQQHQPIERTIAVKVLRTGLDSRSVLQRFEAERQLLSKMNHPGIASVLDAGKTELGQPYIAMEFVDGVEINQYCNDKQLQLLERLKIFAQVCQAVQHAHQKGVIHRDIKPSNVLVCEVDGKAVVKVIDFGVSKAIQDEVPEETITRTMQLVGTPQYMSPEQASTISSDIDTRTDVYSLGVLLYELATGLLPFDAKKLRSASVGQIERMIREIDPQRPSSRVSRLEGGEKNQLEIYQGSTIGHIVRTLRGEIDWVILKSMEKDRDRRYPTAFALCDDINRVIDSDVVNARPPSRAYSMQKFVQRNLAATLIVLTIFGSLLTLAGLSFGYARSISRANKEIQTTMHDQEQVLLFTEEMLGGIDPAVARGQDTTLFRSILDTARERVDTDLSDTPRVEVRVRTLIGKLYASIGDFDESFVQYTAAVKVGTDELGEDDLLTIAARIALGTAHVNLSDYDTAEAIFVEVLEDARRVLGNDDPDTLVALSDLAAVYNHLGDYEKAVKAGESLLQSRIRQLGSDHDDTMSTRNSLALALKNKGDYDRSRLLFEEVLANQIDNLGGDHPNTLKTRSNLALLYHDLDQHDKAIEMNSVILDEKKKVLGDQHPSVIVSMVNLGAALEDAGDDEKALDMFQQALAISTGTLGETHQYSLIICNNLAKYYGRQNDFESALRYSKQSCDGLSSTLGDQHPMTLQAKSNLAQIMLDIGSNDDALDLALSIDTIASEVFEPTDRRQGSISEVVAKCYAALDQTDEALAHYAKATENYAAAFGLDSEPYLRVTQAVRDLQP